MIGIGATLCRYNRSLVALAFMVGSGSSAVAGQLGAAGRVLDHTGRPLPFVVVTSRTGNGFLSTYTDLNGHFAFPGRPHRPGHTLDVRAVGFVSRVIRLAADARTMLVQLDSTSIPAGAGWAIGLGVVANAQLISGGAGVDLSKLRVGEDYQLRVVTGGRMGCSKAGPSSLRIEGTEVTVAITNFVRNRDCGTAMTDHEHLLMVSFVNAGIGTIRILGRYADVVMPIAITNANQ